MWSVERAFPLSLNLVEKIVHFMFRGRTVYPLCAFQPSVFGIGITRGVNMIECSQAAIYAFLKVTVNVRF